MCLQPPEKQHSGTLLLQAANKSLYILLHGLAGRVPDAVATYCTLIRHMVGTMPSTFDPMTTLRAMYPFAPSQTLAPIALAITDKQLSYEQVKQELSYVLVSSAFSGEDMRHKRFCEVSGVCVSDLSCLLRSTWSVSMSQSNTVLCSMGTLSL